MPRCVAIVVSGEHDVVSSQRSYMSTSESSIILLQFHDAFVRAGYEGAQRLHQAIRQEIFQNLLEQRLISRKELMDPSIVTSIHVYTNLGEMALSYACRRVICWPEDFSAFFNGFNAGLPNHQANLIDKRREDLRRGDCLLGRTHLSFEERC